MSAPKPGSVEWRRIVTASKVAGILGISPWESQVSVWYLMHGDVEAVEENAAMRRGNMLENAVLDWFLADHPHLKEEGRQQFCQLPDDPWAAATPDMHVVNTDSNEIELVDAKTTSDGDSWGAPGTDEVPPYYLASSLWQLAMDPDAKRVNLAVLMGRPFDISYYVIERDDEMIGGLIDTCRAFYDTLAADTPPRLDGHPATYDTIRRIHPEVDRDAAIDLDWDDALLYLSATRDMKDAAEEDRLQKAALLNRMGRARLATYKGVVIARRQPNKHGVSLVPVATLATLDELTDQEIA